jgi:hypothetical protein
LKSVIETELQQTWALARVLFKVAFGCSRSTNGCFGTEPNGWWRCIGDHWLLWKRVAISADRLRYLGPNNRRYEKKRWFVLVPIIAAATFIAECVGYNINRSSS